MTEAIRTDVFPDGLVYVDNCQWVGIALWRTCPEYGEREVSFVPVSTLKDRLAPLADKVFDTRMELGTAIDGLLFGDQA